LGDDTKCTPESDDNVGPSGLRSVTSVTPSPLGDDDFWPSEHADSYLETLGEDS
jgi:hypothetical protein